MEKNFYIFSNAIKDFIRSSFIEKIITLILSVFIIFSLSNILKWVIYSADWTVIIKNLSLFAFGSYPQVEIWRPFSWIIYFVVIAYFTFFKNLNKHCLRLLTVSWIVYVPLGIWLLSGNFGLVSIPTAYWGGLTLTIILTASSLFFSLPFGILLALLRQSDLPLIRFFSKTYIEYMRSFPLITVLFFGQLLIPLFLPYGIEVNRVARAVLAFTLFLSAYIAEDFRGGLQSISYNQLEAAEVLGLNYFQINFYIIIPQALKIALPALTNQVIGLLQNTSLMSILGLVELLGISRSLLANPEFMGRYLEVYLWLAIVYWLFSTIISLLGRQLESKMQFGQLTN